MQCFIYWKLVWFSTSKKGECQVINALRLIDKCALSTLTLAFSIKILDIVCFVYDTVCELKGRMNTIALSALCIGRRINTISNVVSIMVALCCDAGFVCWKRSLYDIVFYVVYLVHNMCAAKRLVCAVKRNFLAAKRIVCAAKRIVCATKRRVKRE